MSAAQKRGPVHGWLKTAGIPRRLLSVSPHTGRVRGPQNRGMSPLPSNCTLTLLKQNDGPAPSRRWEIRYENEPLGDFDSLNEALATARTMAAHWLGEAETVRVTGGDLSAVFIDECYSRSDQRTASDDS